ncbi:hypothetical protein D3C87_2092880 [compost metagenome]
MAFPKRRLHHHYRNPRERIIQPVSRIQQPRTDNGYSLNLHRHLTDIGVQLLSADPRRMD